MLPGLPFNQFHSCFSLWIYNPSVQLSTQRLYVVVDDEGDDDLLKASDATQVVCEPSLFTVSGSCKNTSAS